MAAREAERAVVALVLKATGARVEDRTPEWIKRPGRLDCGQQWTLICRIYSDLTGLELPEAMPRTEWRRLDAILVMPGGTRRILEFDEVQHFNEHRAATLHAYPAELPLGFDRATWRARSQGRAPGQGGGFAKPRPPLFPGEGGRHRQRAYRDALADIVPLEHGFAPTLRIATFEVEPWLCGPDATDRMAGLLARKLEA